MSGDSSDNDDLSVVRSSTKTKVKKNLILSDDSSGEEGIDDTPRYRMKLNQLSFLFVSFLF